jgi:predicted N-acetyltransferase YhbS
MVIGSLADHIDQLPELARLHHAQWSHVSRFTTVDQHADKLRSRISQGRDGIPATYVLLIDGAVTGSVSLIDCDDIGDVRPDLSPWLASLYVEPSRRRLGNGSALVKHCIEQAKQLGCSTLYLYTDTHSKFYERFGWRAIERRVSRGLDVSVMALKLAI